MTGLKTSRFAPGRWVFYLGLGVATFIGSVSAQARTYEQHPAALEFVDHMVSEHQLDRGSLHTLLGEARYRQSIIDAMNRPAEKVKLWKDYRGIFVTEKRIRLGVEFWRKHQSWLEKMEQDFGVPVEYVVAIIGVETYYGRVTGSYRVIDALSTLAFDYPRRSSFFKKELEHFILLSNDQRKDPLQLKGSYAGAMGYGQFMPSSYRAYAVDYNGDGQANIWSDPVDAIGSVANYFVRHGWQRGGAVVVPAKAGENFGGQIDNKLIKPEQTVAQLQAAGFTPLQALPTDLKGLPLRLEGEQGAEFWLALDNFYTITRYNHSFRYAMAVTQLAEAIARRVDS